MKAVYVLAITSVLAAPAMPFLVLNQKASPEWTVKISGGHETEGPDRGRPVVLVAGGLGVKPEVFREAFSHVRPAPGGERPTEERAQQNKRALMDALGKHGVTNELLDTVSNYYRYRREQGEMWPTKPAVATAIVTNGKLTGFKVTSGGSGYSSVPTVTVVGHPEIKVEVVISYGKDLSKNGSISEIKILPKK